VWVRRWHLHNTAKLNDLGHAPRREANAIHSKVLLLPRAILHSRPLMAFTDSVPSMYVEHDRSRSTSANSQR
jgi:hypothetical protein